MRLFAQGTGANQIVRDMKMSKFAVYRITHNAYKARDTLASWGYILETLQVR